ncbi:S49 family peptidase [Granulosicoccus sp. 3-233]|uniref:S49 family peptidase n=1 Tax=Granulosicoccus sp. 3-233 TaxID=3417969 RepID=UPI003D33BC19
MNLQALATQARNDQWLISSDAYSAVIDALALGTTGANTPRETVSKQDATAVVQIHGPLLSRHSVLSEALGWPSYTEITGHLAALEANEDVSRIVLAFDSPGGQVSGVHELAQTIKSMSTTVDAFVSGNCASAAYWLASQCDSITASATAIVGSIGVRTIYSGKDPRSILASTSPRKDLNADDWQAVATALNEVFIADVARGRGVSADHVKKHYGQGGIFVGTQALTAGLVDSIGLMSEVVAGNHHAGSEQRQQESIEAGWQAALAESAEIRAEALIR